MEPVAWDAVARDRMEHIIEDLPTDVLIVILKYVAGGCGKVDAIRTIRDGTGLPLRESMEVVDYVDMWLAHRHYEHTKNFSTRH